MKYILDEQEYRDLTTRAGYQFQQQWKHTIELKRLHDKIKELEDELKKWKDI